MNFCQYVALNQIWLWWYPGSAVILGINIFKTHTLVVVGIEELFMTDIQVMLIICITSISMFQLTMLRIKKSHLGCKGYYC